MTTIPEGWTPHDGSGCPVDAEVIVSVMFANKLVARPVCAGFWNGQSDQWHDSGNPYDIIAYRLENPNDKP